MCSDKHRSSYPYFKQSLHLIKAIRDMCIGTQQHIHCFLHSTTAGEQFITMLL